MQVDLESLALPSVSEAGMRILDVLSQEDYSLNDLADVAAEDPALSGLLIKYANSPLYRRVVEITSARKAINLLGVKNVKLVVTLAAMRSMSSVSSMAVEKLWEHSFGLSVLCRLVALKVDRFRADDYEFLGIIHDMMVLTMTSNYPKEYGAMVKCSSAEDLSLDELEEETFEFSRETFINWLSENLHLPKVLTDATKLFCGIEVEDAGSEVVMQQQVLELAHMIDYRVRSDEEVRIIQRKDDELPTICKALGLTDEELDEVVEEYSSILKEHFVL